MNIRARIPPDRSRIAAAAFAVFIAIDLLAVTMRRLHHSGDFDISMEFGRRFAAGEPLYRGGLHFPYLPAAAMFFSPFALLPRPVAFLLFYGLAVTSLWLVIAMLAAMVSSCRPALRGRTWALAAAAIILGAHYIIRDLDDGGPNLILLALLTGGIYCAFAQREAAAALCFGGALALKATAAIFIPFLFWKRRFRLAIYTTASAAVWIVLPVLRMGPNSWWEQQRQWITSALGFAAGYNSAAAHFYGAANIDNQALRPALIYLLDTHSHLRPGAAALIATAAAIALLAIFAALTARPYRQLPGMRWLSESAGLLILALLLAPIAWTQHMVLVLPALYLIAAWWFGGERGPLSTAALILYIVLTLVLNRSVIGKAGYDVLLQYHAQTLCLLLILALVMLERGPDDAIGAEAE